MVDTSVNYPFFAESELLCPCCGKAEMDQRFMDRLVGLRSTSNVVMPVTSGYRCKVHNAKVKGRKTSPHLIGRAIDVNIYHGDVFKLLALIAVYGFTGVGFKQTGNRRSRIIHLDDIQEEPDRIRPTVWTY